MVVALAGVFAWSLSTLGIIDRSPTPSSVTGSAKSGDAGAADACCCWSPACSSTASSIFLIFLPMLVPIAQAYDWDLIWFGVLLTMNMAIGQFTPPMAVNLLVPCKIAGIGMESTVRSGWSGSCCRCSSCWCWWLAFPPLALWLPGVLGY